MLCLAGSVDGIQEFLGAGTDAVCLLCPVIRAKVDELLNKAKVEMDEETRKELYKEAMQIIYIDDPAAVFTNQRKIIYCMSDKVEGFQVDMRKAINYTTLKCRE